MFQGQSIRIELLGDSGLVELCFDRQGESINKLDERTMTELRETTALLAGVPTLRGVLVTSAKDVFIVGADITEFGQKFSKSAEEITEGVLISNDVLHAFEDLPVPSVVAINGFALGGGLEMALSASVRVMSDTAQIGVPEVKLGLFPGLGGTVRLSRVSGPAVAIDWVVTGKSRKAAEALTAGVVDEVVEASQLRACALSWLVRAADGGVDWRARQASKRSAVTTSADEQQAVFAAGIEQAQRFSTQHQPAALMAVEMMARACPLDRAGAIGEEARAFGAVAKTQAAASLVRAFLNEQALKKIFKRHARAGRPVRQAAVLGAGIMGGGIAFTSALKGIPVRMKDINVQALDAGIAEAAKQLARQVKSGRITQARSQQVLGSITAQLDFANFDEVDFVVEAIVENLGVKQKVLAELETQVAPTTLIASNTSSLLIDDIGRNLARPQNFVGMHFFNPVHVMPLVEVIQGSRTSDEAVSTAVSYAVAMGKSPIVVKDCPGFLVNRVLTAYVRGFLQLVADGADFEQVDRVMEAFGWPMGPAYLEDVVGMDTGAHVCDVIAAGYPERMPPIANDALRLMVNEGRFGQKNGRGFYHYEPDPHGKPRRSSAPEAHALLARIQPNGLVQFSESEIVDRMMLPLIIEAAHTLEEGVVATAGEMDMAMLLGVGFPAYAGGPLQYADWLGMSEVLRRCTVLERLGPAYQPTPRMQAMAEGGERYYPI